MPQGVSVSHCPGSNSHILVMSPEPKNLRFGAPDLFDAFGDVAIYGGAQGSSLAFDRAEVFPGCADFLHPLFVPRGS